MDRLKELKQARAALIKDGRKMLDKAEEEKRSFNEDEQIKYDDLMSEVETKKVAIETEERQIALESGIENYSNEPIRNKPEPETKGFKSFGEQLQAVVNASRAGGIVDQRLVESRATGLGESVAADGGFLVQKDYATELLKNVFETGILASRVKKVPISSTSNSLVINGIDESTRANSSRWGGLVTYWLEEAGTKLASKPKFKQIELKLKKLIGLCYATDELLQDTSALESIISQAFVNEFGFVIDDAIFEGTGAGQPLGIMNSGSLISVTRAGALGITYADVVGMHARMIASSRPNAVWLINQAVEPQLYQMVLGTAPAYMPAGGLSGAPYASLFGRPIIPIEQCSNLGTKGDICYFDLSQYLMIDKGGMQTATSIHVSFVTDEQVFRFVYRVDGQPIWSAALTPFKGSSLSPFVTLAT